jgi:hypothetical protein
MGAQEEIEHGGDHDDADAENTDEAPHVRLAAPPQPVAPPPPSLSEEDRKRLHATLDDLVACRKLLDAALAEPT